MEELLKPATHQDIDFIVQLMHEYYALDDLEYNEHEAREAVLYLLEKPSLGNIYLIQPGGLPVGYVVLTHWYSLEFRGRSAFIDEIYLRPDFRRTGLGSQAIAWLAQHARAQGIKTLRLEVEHDNTLAQNAYSKNGFVIHDRHLMTKWL